MGREELINNIWRACDIMRRDNNCGGVIEYVEHLSWLLFIKFFDDQESIYEQKTAIAGQPYRRVIDGKYRWSNWVPMALGKKISENGRRTPPEWNAEQFMQFIRGDLLPYLASLSGSPERDVIAGVFNDRNVVICASPYNLMDVIGIIDDINFRNEDDIHTVSKIYEDLLQKLGNDKKHAGEFYTPRSLIRFIIDVIDPQIGETVYDPACGSAGFLVEAFEYMRKKAKTAEDISILQHQTFVGQEKKSVPALLGLINMVLHGVLVPDIRRRNTLEEDISNVSECFNVVLTNPPFGSTESAQIQKNFPVKSNATELLFIEHILKKLKLQDGVRCGMVVPEGTLFRGGAFAIVKEELHIDFDLFMVVSLPPGTFAPYSDVKTALLFFQRSGPTEEVLYYELPLPEGLKKFSKSSPIRDEYFDEAREVWSKWKDYRDKRGPKLEFSDRAWTETLETLAERGYDLSARNPYHPEGEELPHPTELTAMLHERSREFQSIVDRLHQLVGDGEDS